MTEVIRIDTGSTAIPVKFGNLDFEFQVDDESIEQFRAKAGEIVDKLEKVKPQGKELQETKKILKQGYDAYLGEGAFEQIYKQTPSVIKLTEYFVALSESIASKLKLEGLAQDQESKASKYLKK